MSLARSSFYADQLRANVVSESRPVEDRIRSLFVTNKGRYGSPRITSDLRDEGFCIGENKVADLMRKMGLRANQKSSFKPKTTINNPASRKADRVFKVEETQVTKPNQVWVSDLTYLPFAKSFLYLVVYLDVYTRRVKSWELASNMKSVHTKRAFLKAIKATNEPLADLIAHSDQGVQYCSSEYQSILNLLSVTPSMSRKGNCYDNAFAESFFATLKKELDLSHCKTEYEVKEEIENYVSWYNNKRKHSALGYKSPADFESNCEAFTA